MEAIQSNLELQADIDEARTDIEEDLYSIEEDYQQRVHDQAAIKAAKILKKNRREIKRLKRHAEIAVYENNYVAYEYAIKKLRGFYKQPYTDSLIKTMWETTRSSLLKAVKQAVQKQ